MVATSSSVFGTEIKVCAEPNIEQATRTRVLPSFAHLCTEKERNKGNSSKNGWKNPDEGWRRGLEWWLPKVGQKTAVWEQNRGSKRGNEKGTEIAFMGRKKRKFRKKGGKGSQPEVGRPERKTRKPTKLKRATQPSTVWQSDCFYCCGCSEQCSLKLICI